MAGGERRPTLKRTGLENEGQPDIETQGSVNEVPCGTKAGVREADIFMGVGVRVRKGGGRDKARRINSP